MIQEHKELLLKDLCARLPYGVKGIITYNGDKNIFTVKGVFNILFLSDTECCRVEDFKPYLFPLSSMTEEQRKEYESLCIKETSECVDLYGIRFTKDYYYDNVESIDYLYKNHIDVRDLIPKGLAHDATGLNIY